MPSFFAIVFFPDFSVVVWRHGAAVHADGFYRGNLSELLQIPTELVVCFIHISFTGVHGFVMVANFMAKCYYFFDDGHIVTL